MAKRRSLWYGLYTWLVIATGYGILIGLLSLLDIDNWRVYAVLAVLGILAEWLVVALPHGNISLGFAVVMATFLLFDFAATAWVSVISALVSNGILNKESPFRTTLFNGAQYAIAAIAAGKLYELAGGGAGVKVSWENALPLLVFIASYFVINHLLVNIYLAPFLKHYTLSMWKAALKWDFYTYAFAAPVGILMALLYKNVGITGAVLLFLPVLMLKYLFRLYINLELANKELSVLYEVAKTIGGSLDLEKTLRLILYETKRVVNYHTGVIYIWQEEDQLLVPAAIQSPFAEKIKDVNIRMGEGIIGWAAQSRDAQVIHDTRKDPRLRGQGGLAQLLRSLVVVPLLVENKIVGVAAVGRREAAAFGPKQVQLLSILGGQAAVAMANSLLYRKIEEMAITDGLTQLYNYRFFFRRLAEEAMRARRYKLVFSVIMLDIDYFKKFNDQYGHQAGDTALSTVAKILQENTRAVDVVARYGGEEFAILLPETAIEQAHMIAERMRQAVNDYRLELAPEKNVELSISVGVACFPKDADNEIDLVERADQALYMAKETGRNRVCVWSQKAGGEGNLAEQQIAAAAESIFAGKPGSEDKEI